MYPLWWIYVGGSVITLIWHIHVFFASIKPNGPVYIYIWNLSKISQIFEAASIVSWTTCSYRDLSNIMHWRPHHCLYGLRRSQGRIQQPFYFPYKAQQLSDYPSDIETQPDMGTPSHCSIGIEIQAEAMSSMVSPGCHIGDRSATNIWWFFAIISTNSCGQITAASLTSTWWSINVWIQASLHIILPSSTIKSAET